MSTHSDMSPPMGEELDLALFERHWFGETTPAEAAYVDEWFRTHPERREWYAQFGASIRDGIREELCPRRPADAWAQLTAAILGAPQAAPLAFPQRPTKEAAGMAGPATVRKLFGVWPQARLGMHAFRRTAGLGMALGAVILAVMAIAGGIMLRRSTPGAPIVEPSTAVAMRDYRTARGQRAEIHLADGTKVVLAPETHLGVPATIGDPSVATRQVVLDGEAYFDVVHDARRPFSVRTASGIARDIGTAFNVRAYPEIHGMQVTVASGVVAIHGLARNQLRTSAAASSDAPHDTPQVAMLYHGDQATLSTAGALTVARGVDVTSATAWARGHLVFADTPIQDVARALGRWYDLDIRLTDTTSTTRRLALTLRDEPAAAALNLVALALDLRVERQGSVVILSPLHTK